MQGKTINIFCSRDPGNPKFPDAGDPTIGAHSSNEDRVLPNPSPSANLVGILGEHWNANNQINYSFHSALIFNKLRWVCNGKIS